jgi:hypothetical protein
MHIEHYVPRCRACHHAHDGKQNAKLTAEQVLEIRRRYGPLRGGGQWGRGPDAPPSFVSLAKEYGVDRRTISRIVRRETWNDVDAEVPEI